MSSSYIEVVSEFLKRAHEGSNTLYKKSKTLEDEDKYKRVSRCMYDLTLALRLGYELVINLKNKENE